MVRNDLGSMMRLTSIKQIFGADSEEARAGAALDGLTEVPEKESYAKWQAQNNRMLNAFEVGTAHDPLLPEELRPAALRLEQLLTAPAPVHERERLTFADWQASASFEITPRSETNAAQYKGSRFELLVDVLLGEQDREDVVMLSTIERLEKESRIFRRRFGKLAKEFKQSELLEHRDYTPPAAQHREQVFELKAPDGGTVVKVDGVLDNRIKDGEWVEDNAISLELQVPPNAIVTIEKKEDFKSSRSAVRYRFFETQPPKDGRISWDGPTFRHANHTVKPFRADAQGRLTLDRVSPKQVIRVVDGSSLEPIASINLEVQRPSTRSREVDRD